MTFKEAVEAAPHPVREKYRSGKQALIGYRNRVNCADSRRLTGSIDLDSALKREQPHAARWDYGLGYRPPRDGNRQSGSKFTRRRPGKYRRSSKSCNG